MSDNQSVLDAIKDKLTQGHILSAIADLGEYLVGAPENTQALYLLAVALRFKGEPSLALVTLDRLKRLSASHSRAYQETGHCHRDIGDQNRGLAGLPTCFTAQPSVGGRAAWTVERIKCAAQGAVGVASQAAAGTVVGAAEAVAFRDGTYGTKQTGESRDPMSPVSARAPHVTLKACVC